MWIRDQIDARGYESTEEAARALGVYPSLLRHWATIVRSPSPQVLRQVAVLFDAPIQDVLIAAGYMTEEENRPLSPTGCRCNKCRTANPRRDMPPHSRRHRRTPYSSASERSTSHPRRMDQHTLGVPPSVRSLYRDQLLASRVVLPLVGRTLTAALAREQAASGQSRPRRVFGNRTLSMSIPFRSSRAA